MSTQEIIEECLDNIDFWAVWEIEEILSEAGISKATFREAYATEFN